MERPFTNHLSFTQVKRLWREAKFGDRTRCPYCGHERKLWSLNDDRWKCSQCQRKFGLFTKSWLSRVRFDLPEILELLYWFELGLTDHDIADHVNTDYRRIHRFLLRVRDAIADYEDRTIQVLEGTVEVDESYFGAQFKNRRRAKRQALRKAGKIKRGRGAKDLQQAVFGIYERSDGLVYVEPVEDATQKTIHSILKGKVTVESTVYTDTYQGYQGLDESFETHETITHWDDEYVRGDVTINGIEGFWAFAEEHLRRHHGISESNFLSYLKEKEFRWNERSLDQDEFVKLLLHVLAQK
jgi:transposase